MKRVLGISLLAITVGLTGCSSEETSSKGSATEAKAETKIQNREDVKLADNEILVINEETGEAKKVEAVETESTKGFTLKLPIGYQLNSLDESADSAAVKINALYDSYIMITPSTSDWDIKNKPTYQSYLGSKYGGISKDGKYTEMNVTNFKDPFVQKNIVYLVEFTPVNDSKKKAYGGLVSVNVKCTILKFI
ncbi:hypothetical protein [Niallia taxi]|uniref:hypothetical protein n=1 Tax=Niallia taxi TaxID=2499688 RepID=UPI003D266587